MGAPMMREMATKLAAPLFVVLAALVSLAGGQTCNEATLGSTWPNTNRPTYCCPYAGDGTAALNTSRTCRKIEPSTASYYIGSIGDPNPCYWTNLAGQTPDTVSVWNSPFKNWMPTIGAYSKPASWNTAAELPTGTDYEPAYYAQVRTPNSGGYQYGFAECQVAQEYYNAFNSALNRYNCEEQYSHWNCDDCRKAYARWAAAMALPACALQSGDTEGGTSCSAIKPCVRICNEVVQKCPVTLGFTCPTDNRDYSDAAYCTTLSAAEVTSMPKTLQNGGGQYYSATEAQSDLTFTTDCCNPMGLQNSARAVHAGMLLLAFASLLVLTLVL